MHKGTNLSTVWKKYFEYGCTECGARRTVGMSLGWNQQPHCPKGHGEMLQLFFDKRSKNAPSYYNACTNARIYPRDGYVLWKFVK